MLDYVCNNKNDVLNKNGCDCNHPVMRARSGKAKNPHAVALSALGASKGGKARAAKLSAKELSEQGKRAVQARWAKARRKRT